MSSFLRYVFSVFKVVFESGKTYLGVFGGELALEELAEVSGVEMAEWFGLVRGVATEDQEKRVLAPVAPDELDDLPRPVKPTSVCVEQLLCG